MKQASALKVREYCSRGIPFMISNNDPDFPPAFPYCLSLPPDDTPVSMDTVIGFYHTVYAHQFHPGEMREYAEDHLDWQVKGLQLTAFIRKNFWIRWSAGYPLISGDHSGNDESGGSGEYFSIFLELFIDNYLTLPAGLCNPA